jgi:hypothetical protein
MAVSAARLLANRRNALKSTGPKTVEGKQKSRQNAYKHGLTGDGVVLPEEDRTEIQRRFELLNQEQQPSCEASRIFLRRFSFLSVRLEKCEEFDVSATANRIRHAVEVFDDNRLTEVEELAARLANQPATVARRLQNSPEGVDWLIRNWGELREDLLNPERAAWTLNHWTRLEQLLGNPGGNYRMSRGYALTQAVSGYFVYLSSHDGEGLDDTERVEWARHELKGIIDAEMARLAWVKSTLDLPTLEQDRREAPSRALFDPSPAMNLARRYEAATERAMYKALDQFHEVELLGLESEHVSINTIAEEPADRLASFCPEPEPAEEPPAEPVESAPRSVYLPEPRVETRPTLKTKAARRQKRRLVPA